ncbi:SpvB/TcaC N-terminal domain-containing protein [Pseudomonas batumici]|uniref:SpvB/TcaC N-terminal domain-containing protein n=1 Tax=Pseudomonas batumici TaxID=226910 RepID=UPI0030D21BE5
MDKKHQVRIPELSLPKGGGAIQGMGESLKGGGMSGGASLSLPLPLSPGRGLTPGLALQYSSAGGNGAFGLGFGLGLPRLSRRTSQGVPLYADTDEFLDPNGEILVVETDSHGQPLGTKERIGAEHYRVTRYLPCVEGGFDRLEYWQGDKQAPFWRIRCADGSQQLFGKSAEARISDPDDPRRILDWLLEESVSVNGEHVLYGYKPEDAEGVDTRLPAEVRRERRAQRYLKRVRYANRAAAQGLYLLDDSSPPPKDTDWLFELLFDYGEHAVTLDDLPDHTERQPWPARADAFSSYSGGFEVRTHRLCRQVLMFHRFEALAPDLAPTLVSRLALEYDESALVTQLRAAYGTGYGLEPVSRQLIQVDTPPLEFGFTGFDLEQARFAPFEALTGLNDGVFCQMVDLYGEGLAGVLWRDGSSYLYRAPCRADDPDDEDAIAYAPWQPLPQLPSGGLPPWGHRALLDLTGDGRLDWVISQPGLAGFFSLSADGQWQGFVPFSAFPTEFLAPSAQLADVLGRGLADLVLIGPKSVRLYANRRAEGFCAPVEVEHSVPDALPIGDSGHTELVAFADMLASGQSHLVRVRHDSLTCWPNLGHGRFGASIQLASLPFEAMHFDPARVFLADLDGKGAADLIYVEHDRLRIFRNHSGNALAEPVELLFPEGVYYDNLCQVSFADVKGSGCASLVLTQPHMTLKHWLCEFTPAGKPYLLERLNNNRGLEQRLVYRSSAQEWLDEKQANPAAVSRLPFALQVLSRQLSLDEISGNTCTQRYHYRQGYYDGQAREFRGFGLVSHLDAETLGSGDDTTLTAPVLTRTWYRVGTEGDDLREGYNTADSQAWPLGQTRYTDLHGEALASLAADELHEARRALRGRVRREEVFGADASEQALHPYTVTEFRYQVHQVQGGEHRVWLALPLESIAWQYERDPSDPLCAHQVVLEVDRYGQAVRNATVNYPRRPNPRSPDECNDEQQTLLYINESQTRYIHLDQGAVWRLGLSCEDKSHVLHWPAAQAPQGLLDFERLSAVDGPLRETHPRVLTGWTRQYYRAIAQDEALPLGQATIEALPSHVHQVEEASAALAELFTGFLDGDDLGDTLQAGGYLLAEGHYWKPSAQSHYWPLSGFFRVKGQTDPFGAATGIDYDRDYWGVSHLTDALGNVVQAEYDYRVLQPWRMTDPNENVEEVAYDPLGRRCVSSFYGTEEGNAVGFAPIASYTRKVKTLEQAILDPEEAIQRAAQVYFYEAFSWMGTPDLDKLADSPGLKSDQIASLRGRLRASHWLTRDGHLRARQRWSKRLPEIIGLSPEQQQSVLELLASVKPTPVHSAVLTHDRYPDDPERQIRCALVFADGFGRSLQSKLRVEPGEAYMLGADGGLAVDNNQLISRPSDPRWVVSERIEYNNKGLPVRTYQPYFLDSHHYANDASLRLYGCHDTFFYDPLGRNTEVITAAGYRRRTRYGVWFDSYEDENDMEAEQS